jgi:O-acetyl-ADP-ribose deacetylase (regulator of RNase III)
MEQARRLDFLLEYLLAELPDQAERDRPALSGDYAERRSLFRALVNIRAPRAVSSEFLQVQDAFLQEEARQKGIVSLKDIPPFAQDGRISLWQGDITRLAVDAIVNAANSGMLGCFAPGHHCIDNAIHTAAGLQLRNECHALMERQGHPEQIGRAKITHGYNLPARHIIHTVGPQVQHEPSERQKRQLAECYTACIHMAAMHEIRSLAFCCISTGVFAFPGDLAACIAIKTVRACLEREKSIERIIFNVFLDEDRTIYESLLE